MYLMALLFQVSRYALYNLFSAFPFLLVSFLCLLSQLMRLWYLSHRRPAKAQASLRIRAVSPEPSLFANMNYGCRRRVRPNIRNLMSWLFFSSSWCHGLAVACDVRHSLDFLFKCLSVTHVLFVQCERPA